jgi:hypothetical protein
VVGGGRRPVQSREAVREAVRGSGGGRGREGRTSESAVPAGVMEDAGVWGGGWWATYNRALCGSRATHKHSLMRPMPRVPRPSPVAPVPRCHGAR